jgi:hypothetical protein
MAESNVAYEKTEQFAEDIERQRDVLVPPTAEQIDRHIADYQQRKAEAEKAQEFVDDAKKILVFLADHFGHRPAHAEQSLRLQGLRNAAVVTRSTTVVVDESAVIELQKETLDIPAIFPRLFAVRIKHTLIEGARDVLKALDLPRRKHEKVLALFGKCFDVKTNAPSLKVEVIKPEKPAKKPRAAKAVA